MKILTLLMLILSMAWAAAASESIRIEGQIFIARKDRETVKLSSVTVRIVPRKVAQEVIEGLSKIRKLEGVNDQLRERSFALVKALPKLSPEKAALANKTLETLREQVVGNSKIISELRGKCLEDRSASLGNIYFTFGQARWQAAKIVQTDPDGRFLAEVPPGEYFIVAWATRTILDHEEKYLWAIEAKPGERNLLNNSNLLEE